MTWQLFAILQIALFAGAALAALGLRNRRLRRQSDELLRLCGQAHEELVAVTGKLAEIESIAPPEKLLAERVKALTGDDPVVVVRRMVLEQEIKAKADFADRLTEHLATQPQAPPDEEEFARRWRLIRQECQQLAMFLVADNPDTLPAIQQIFEVIEPLDQAYGLELPELEPQPSTASEDEPGANAAASDGDPLAAGTDGDAQALDQESLDALVAGVQAPEADAPAEADAQEPGNDAAAGEARSATG